MPSLSELRRKLGPHLPDEELVLRAVMPEAQVDDMIAAGPARRDYDPKLRPVLNLLRELVARRDFTEMMRPIWAFATLASCSRSLSSRCVKSPRRVFVDAPWSMRPIAHEPRLWRNRE